MSSTAVPAQLGRYRILSKLGQGGIGAVYKAEDTTLSRRVAVKVPHFNESDGPKVIERFQREARIAAAIDHPNLCPVHDCGEVNGVHFLVMPYIIEGTPLSHLIDEDDLWPLARTAALVRQLALAVEVLHQRGLIHRDLKPSNVLLRPNGEPVLMDFGLARSFTNQSRRLTQTGAALGTPAYMAPEQILGDAKAIGPATDVYELGVILYELLTAYLPFEGPPAAVYGQILHAQPEPPSARRPGIDAALDGVCLKALAKKPAERFASMAAFAEALQPWACPVAAVVEPTLIAPAAVSAVPRLTCPGCGKSLKVPPATAGKRLKCPRCHAVLAGASPATQNRSPRERSSADTAAPSLLETMAAPPPRLQGHGSRTLLLGAGLAVLAVVLLVVGAWLLWPGGEQPVPSLPAKVVEKPSPSKELRNSLGMKLMLIPKGTFTMGSPKEEKDRSDDEEQHEVEITQPFYMGATEVTQEQYEKVMGTNPSYFASTGDGKDKVQGLDTRRFPVESVSWKDAVEFCEKQSALPEEKKAGRLYRLPSEAEWEYACRGGATSSKPFHFGDTLSAGAGQLREQAWANNCGWLLQEDKRLRAVRHAWQRLGVVCRLVWQISPKRHSRQKSSRPDNRHTPSPARRFLGQQWQVLPFGLPRRQRSRRPQRQPRLSGGLCCRREVSVTACVFYGSTFNAGRSDTCPQRNRGRRNSVEAAGNRRRSASIIGAWREKPQDRPKPCHRAAIAAQDIPLRVIRRFARAVADRFQPERIILFGSHAYGTPHADSDVDILVVMPAPTNMTRRFGFAGRCRRRSRWTCSFVRPKTCTGGCRKAIRSSARSWPGAKFCMKKLTREWVKKAEADHAVAVLSSRKRLPLHDAVCFPGQQCAEKYLKALREEAKSLPTTGKVASCPEKKCDHESTKIRKHEREPRPKVSYFRAFVLSCFRDRIFFLDSSPLSLLWAAI